MGPGTGGGDRDDAVLERIRKLLALAKSPNEHEALAAAEKAQHLMLRHSLSEAQVAAERGETPAVDEAHVRSRGSAWRRRLASAIAHNADCRVIFVAESLTATDFTFVGPRDTVSAVGESYRFVEAALLSVSAAATAARAPDDPPAWRREFLEGATERVEDRLAERRAKTLDNADAGALVLYRGAIEKWLVDNYELTSSATPQVASEGPMDAWTEGWHSGKDVPLGRREIDG